jgi:hypothetical protein
MHFSTKCSGLGASKEMVTFQLNDLAKAADQDDFGLLLSVVEGEVDEGTQVGAGQQM